MISFKNLWPHWGLTLATLCLTLFFFPQLPAQVPLHWNLAGEVDRYGGRLSILLLPALMLGLVAMAWGLPRIDPRRENYARFSDSYLRMMFFVQLFFAAFHAVTLSETLQPGRVNITVLALGGCGLLMTCLGNLMPKIKHNYFAGIRTPWTLNSEETWYATHRLGGKLFFYGGLAIIAAAFLPVRYAMGTLVGVVIICTLIPGVYSYWYHRETVK